MDGTEGPDVYDQQVLGPTDWITYYGLGGNDIIRMYNGTAVPGSGVDLVEKLPSTDWWRGT